MQAIARRLSREKKAVLVTLVAAFLGSLLLAALVAPASEAQSSLPDNCQVSGITVTCTFTNTGNSQSWTVPEGITQATFDVYGAQGGSSTSVLGVRAGGLGGKASAPIAVTPGETLQVNVGGRGGDGAGSAGGDGGFNGGGDGGNGCCSGPGGGGGASDVRRDTDVNSNFTLAERIIVAGGGGGAGGFTGGAGGAGGGLSGDPAGETPSNDHAVGGGGGTQDAGGLGGGPGFIAGLFRGTAGGDGGSGLGGRGGDGINNGDGGGGGGGGYYGGGGGGGGDKGAGGGGGSGFGPSGVVFENGKQSGDGLVTITYTDTTLDTNPPTLSVTHSVDGSNGWNTTTSPVTLNISASDAESGLAGSPTCKDGTTDLTLTAGTAGNWTASVSGEGTHTISCSVSDNADHSTSATDTVKIDTKAPSFSSCSVTPSRLKPPNHKLVTATASVQVTDPTGGSGLDGGFTLVSVESNQADSGLGPDDLPNDIQGWTDTPDDTSGQLRAERFGGARVYTLTYQGKDLAGNTAECKPTVTVPKGG